jgi:hypothetical protein
MSTPIQLEPTCDENKAIIGLVSNHPKYNDGLFVRYPIIISIDSYLEIRDLIKREINKKRATTLEIFNDLALKVKEIIDHEMSY